MNPSRLYPNSTQIPDVILDYWMAKLSGAEFKVLLYICRRTYGFRRETDTVSLSQLCDGITKRNGQRLDHGTGLSRPSVVAALKTLIENHGLVAKVQSQNSDGSPAINGYTINLDAPMVETDTNTDEATGDEGSKKIEPPQLNNLTRGQLENLTTVVKKFNPQHSGDNTQGNNRQETRERETITTARAEARSTPPLPSVPSKPKQRPDSRYEQDQPDDAQIFGTLATWASPEQELRQARADETSEAHTKRLEIIREYGKAFLRGARGGAAWESLPEGERGRIVRAFAQLAEISPMPLPSDVERASANAVRQFGSARCTPNAIIGNWSQLTAIEVAPEPAVRPTSAETRLRNSAQRTIQHTLDTGMVAPEDLPDLLDAACPFSLPPQYQAPRRTTPLPPKGLPTR